MTVDFASLGLSAGLLKAVQDRGYQAPTPVQAAAIPAALQGRDLIASAHTGSGKTAAFALPLLQELERAARSSPRRTRGLVLVPTRELAAQVAEAITALAGHLAPPLKLACVFGGVSINPQMMALRGGADIVVATPGRLLDLVDHNALGLAGVTQLVLDEADRLLDAGFADELARIAALLPRGRQRQTLLFSATFPPAVQALAQQHLHDPLRIDLPDEPGALSEGTPDITQRALQVDAPRRTQLLRHLIANEKWTRVLVFVATRYATEHVADKLTRAGIPAAPLHGELSQGSRTQALADFKAERLKVLVATDLAARGLHIAQLPVVVNYDLPRSAADYVHRIGRTARAGESGVAVSFVTAENEAHFRLIEKRQGKRVDREQVAGFEPTESKGPAAEPGTAQPAPLDPNGGIKGRRKSKKDKLREAAARARATAQR